MNIKNTAKMIQVPQGFLVLTVLLCGVVMTTARAQNELVAGSASACDAGFAETWIIGSACDLGGKTDIKANDAIHIQCDTKTERWTIEFYEEPAINDPQSPSESTRYEICPGNGFLTKNANGKPMLQCNFWEPESNVAKQLEFVLEPITNPRVRSMRWLSRERDNPNVICGIAGRPGDDDTASRGQTIFID